MNKEIDENEYGAVRISSDENFEFPINTLYSISDVKKIKKCVNELLKDIDQKNENGDNELKIFMQIYVKLAKLISYDYDALSENNDDSAGIIKDPYVNYTCRNLVGGLLQGKCVCSGYAEILRNILACRGIECRLMGAQGHAYNQVKIKGKWYYVDLTNDAYNICEGNDLKWCLHGETNFLKDWGERYHKNLPCYIAEKADEDYPADELEKIYREVLSEYEEKESNLKLRQIFAECYDLRIEDIALPKEKEVKEERIYGDTK